MGTEDGKATREQVLQFMTTEHFTLQTAKSATVAEANGRSTLFLSTVSSAVVALAFVGLGAAVFAASVFAHYRYQIKRYSEFEARLKTLFPGGPGQPPS